MKECLESVQKQKYQNWEIIAVDDGSTDESGLILDDFARNDSRIRCLHIKNQGVSHARNHAISMAYGEWIYCLDSDDYLLDSALEIVASSINSFPDADNIRFHFKAIGPEGKLHDTNYIPDLELANKYLDNDLFLKKIILSRWSNPFNSVIKKDIIVKNNLFFNESIHYMEDTLWHIKVSEYVDKCVYVPQKTYVYRYGRPGASNSKVSLRSVSNILGTIEGLKNERTKGNLVDYYDYWINHLSLGVLRSMIKFINRGELLKEARRILPRKLHTKTDSRPDYFLFKDNFSEDYILRILVDTWNVSQFMIGPLITVISGFVPKTQKVNGR